VDGEALPSGEGRCSRFHECSGSDCRRRAHRGIFGGST
jgi:hypothetical protein